MQFKSIIALTLVAVVSVSALPTTDVSLSAREALPLPVQSKSKSASGSGSGSKATPKIPKLKKCSIQGYDYMCKEGETTCKVQLIDQHGKKGAWATGICMELPGQTKM